MIKMRTHSQCRTAFLLVIVGCVLSYTAEGKAVNERRSINNNNNNNNNYNNNNVNVNVNYNTVTITHVTTITSPSITCGNLAFGQSQLAADGCTVTTCSSTGLITSSRTCANHRPIPYDFYVCIYHGSVYQIGDTFTHTDGCNKCVCGVNSIQCTDADACKVKSDCTQNGVGYSSGQSFPHPDGCNLCQCTILGVMCTSNTCTTMPPYTCAWFGKRYRDGDNMPADGCNTCTCNQGRASCTATNMCN